MALNLFATTSLGILLATIARSMPQFGTLMILVLLHLQMQFHRLSAQSAGVRSAKFTQLLAAVGHDKGPVAVASVRS